MISLVRYGGGEVSTSSTSTDEKPPTEGSYKKIQTNPMLPQTDDDAAQKTTFQPLQFSESQNTLSVSAPLIKKSPITSPPSILPTGNMGMFPTATAVQQLPPQPTPKDTTTSFTTSSSTSL